MKILPSYFGHLLGARVALQHSPILRIITDADQVLSNPTNAEKVKSKYLTPNS